MNSIRLKYKFIIIILLASLPASFATYLLAKEVSSSIHFSAKEVDGRDYLQSLSDLHELIGEHRVAYLSSLVDTDSVIKEVRDTLKEGVTQMNSVHIELNKTLEIGSFWDDARSGIEALISTGEGLDYDTAMPLHDQTLEKINILAQVVGGKSNLIHDPDHDSYYLMDAVLLKIPRALDALSSYQVSFTEKNGFMDQLPNRYALEKVSNLANMAFETVNIAMEHNEELGKRLSADNNGFVDNYTKALASLETVRVNSTPELQKQAFADTKIAIANGYTLFDNVNTQLERLLHERIRRAASKRNTMLGIVLSAVCVGMLFTYLVGRSITITVIRAKLLAEAIADDCLDNAIVLKGNDEPAELMSALSVMQEKLNTRINEERQQSITNGRIKQALDCVVSSVMVADVDKRIIYCNNASDQLFQSFESEIAQDVEGFSCNDVIGQSADFLCPGQKMSENTNQEGVSTELDCIVGGRHLRINSSPVKNEDGEALGTVIEVRDRTQFVAVEQAVSNDVVGLVDEALIGNLSGRINSEGKPEFLIPVYKGINDMISICNTVISGVGGLFKRLSDGDLSLTWDTHDSVELQGDFRQLQQDANATVAQLSEMISRVKNDAAIVSASASKVISVNTQLEDNVMSASEKADSVSTAVNSISGNVDSIAGAAEEMNASIKEIVKNTQRSSTVAVQAVDLTKAADARVAQLASSSKDIGDMVKVINSIAEQTNLLALNATIEAARAGDAGKGFAVVANEVKELAKETAKATEDISEKIRTIQNDSDSAADGIREIDNIVQQINELQTSTATAMEQQSATTQEISRSINTVATGTSGISLDIGELAKGTEETSEAVRTAKEEVMQLNQVAGNLQKLVGNFTLSS
jgi:methyl-accepting chemotaxis protein